MEDEGGVKAPVTRLRRRLSVEQTEDARSSPAPNTPTKKRGGRRVAKPELDLIDENAPENDTSKKLTKKANMKDLDIEEKPVTPSRRSARIKSNTSIVLETTQTVDSPRAKRATRRNSQAGSDNEAPVTPARITRRTRRDSANADKAEPQPSIKPAVPVTEIIVEEPEPSSQKLQSSSEKPDEKNQSPSSKRKSPRLSLKRNDKSSDSTDSNDKEKRKSEQLKFNKSTDSSDVKEKELDDSEEHNNSNKENETSENKATLKNLSPVVRVIDISNNLNDGENNRLSISNIELLNKLNTESNKKNKNANKSFSMQTEPHTESFKNKRHRTKSWTGLSDPMQDDNKWYSDSESTKKTKKASLSIATNVVTKNVSKNIEINLNVSANEKKQNVLDVAIKEAETILIDSPSNTEKKPETSETKSVSSTNLFDTEPTNDMKTFVYIEDSDSNSENIKSEKQTNDENQGLTCFDSKVISSKNENVETTLNNSQDNNEILAVNRNDSCEPMDVDETLPDNVIANKSLLKTIDITESKVSPNGNDDMNSSGNEKEKSKRSSLTLGTSQNLDKTRIENKSTLVLSQLKDISNENNISQSPQTTEKSLKSDRAEKFIPDNPKKELTSNYLTSTPIQQKNLKHAIQVNTSSINSNNTSKIDVSLPKIDVPNTDNSNNKAEVLDSGDETSQEENNFMDAEAEEASDDYESGDSRDDEEVQYEKENEIIQKGETLTSEDDLSNDSDYEKDSFVVSSDQEDDDLLDGSGDDLSMSDNELKMTKESKKKYNERKIKEQKKASREMFESRHQLNDSNNSNKSNLIKKKKNRAILDSSVSEDENITVKIKKNKRMLLDSSHENSMNNSLDNASIPQLSNSLSKSVKNVTNEVEMTVVEEDIKNEIDPLSINIKKELNTPQKERTNISIQFIYPKQSEKREVSLDKSQLNMTVADDPLEEENASESSDSSDNVHIQNYDSILNDLNKSMKTKKNKKGDISLNIDKKTKQKAEPIVDQLNLTQIKTIDKQKTKVIVDSGETSVNVKSKKKSNKSIDQSHEEKQANKSLNISSKKSLSKKKSNDEESDNESSASIDLHLLFSEESSNSDDVKIKINKAEESIEDDSFIPLKKSCGKTNILEVSESNNKSQTESAKKIKKKAKALDKSDVENENSVDGTELQFFLDTTGTHNSTAVDQPINANAEKKQEQKQEQIVIDDSDSVPDAPNDMTVAVLNKSKTKTPKSDKKKKRKESLSKEQEDSEESQSIKPNQSIQGDIEMQVNQSDIANKPLNKSVAKTPKSEKKKAKKLIESETLKQEEDSDSEAPTEIANKSVIEKLKQQICAEEFINTSLTATNKSMTKTPKSDKKKKRISESETKYQTDVIEIQPVIEDDIETNVNLSGIANKSIDKSVLKTPKSEKKKVKRTEPQTRNNEENLIATQDEKIDVKEVMNTSLATQNISITKTPKSDKKKKKRMSEQMDEQVLAEESIVTNKNSAIVEQGINEPEAEENETGSQNKSVNKSITKTPKSEKKKKLAAIQMGSDTNETSTKTSIEKKTQQMTESNNAINIENVPESMEAVGSKKRKRKSSLNQIEKEIESQDPIPHTSKTHVNVSISTNSQSKKRKIAHNVEDSENNEQALMPKGTAIEKQQKQGSLKQRHQLENQTNNTRDTTDVNLNNKKVMKKRKEREDDEGSRTAKVLKCDTNDKIPVPRLPASVLDQLAERPAKKTHQVTKPNAISTTNFVVEEAKVKRIKPSSYLEESIYLNEEEERESKKPKYIKNPKVLPFLPTVSTSNSGYTTNFKVNILPKEIQFVAKSTNVSNYKNDYLQNKRVKRLGTYELYKRNRNIKMSKF